MPRTERSVELKRIPLLGLRPDATITGGYTTAINVEFNGDRLQQRNPRGSVDPGYTPVFAEHYKSIWMLEKADKRIILLDLPQDGNIHILAMEDVGTGTEVKCSSYTTVLDDFTDGPGVIPCYTAGDFGAFRVDGGNENIIIEDENTVHQNGVSPPTAAPTFVAGDTADIIYPPQPLASLSAQAATGSGWIEGGIYEVFITYVKESSGTEVESAPSETIQVEVPPGITGKILISFPPSPEAEVTKVNCYRTTKINVDDITEELEINYTFYREGQVLDSVGSFTYTGVDSFLIDCPVYPGNMAGDPDSMYSSYFIYYIYVKTYDDGRIVKSSPSPPLKLTGPANPAFTVGYTESSEPGVTHIWFYRNAFHEIDENRFLRVATTANTGSQITLIGNDDELNTANELLEIDNGKVPPCKFIIQAGRRMIYCNFPGLAGGESTIRYSKTSRFEEVPEGNVTKFEPADGDPITAVAVLFGNLLVFKKNKVSEYIPTEEVFPERKISNTIGCIDQRTMQSVGFSEIIFLSLEGVICYNGTTFKNISRDKIQRTIIKGFINAGARFESAYYQRKHQYHLLMFTVDGGEVKDHRYLVLDIDREEWTEMIFTELDVCLGNVKNNLGEQVVISAAAGGSINCFQYDCDLSGTTAETTTDEITKIATHAAWSSCIDDQNTVFFCGKDENEIDNLYKIPYVADSFQTPVSIGKPAAQVNLLRVKYGGGIVGILGLDNNEFLNMVKYDTTFHEIYLNFESSDIYVPANRLGFFPLETGDVLLSYLSPNPDIPIFDPATEQVGGYQVGDKCFETHYLKIKEYLGSETVVSKQNPTNGTQFYWAYPWPDILENPMTFNYYLYDQSGTLSGGDQIHFAGLHLGTDTGAIREGENYYVLQVEEKIFTLHLDPEGPAIVIAGQYRSHEGTQGNFVYHTISVPPIVKWLPAGQEFQYEIVQEYTVHHWEYLPLTGHIRPFFGLAGSEASFYYDGFEYGDILYANSFFHLVDSQANEWIYFYWYCSAEEKYFVSRLGVGLENPEVGNIFELAPGSIPPDEIRLFVSEDTERIFVSNGTNIKEYSLRAGWSITGLSDDYTLMWVGYCPTLDFFWVYGIFKEQIQQIAIIDKKLKVYLIDDNGILPAGLRGFSPSPDKYFLIACHHSGEIVPPGGGGETSVYEIKKVTEITDIQKSAIVEGIYKSGIIGEISFEGTDLEKLYDLINQLGIKGVKVILISCYLDLSIGHMRKRLKKAFQSLSSLNPALGMLLVCPSRNTLDKALVMKGDIFFSPGAPDYITNDGLNDVLSENEIDVYIGADTTHFKFLLVAGSLSDAHAALKLISPSFQYQVEGELQQDE